MLYNEKGLDGFIASLVSKEPSDLASYLLGPSKPLDVCLFYNVI